jgi:hypothetical protein
MSLGTHNNPCSIVLGRKRVGLESQCRAGYRVYKRRHRYRLIRRNHPIHWSHLCRCLQHTPDLPRGSYRWCPQCMSCQLSIAGYPRRFFRISKSRPLPPSRFWRFRRGTRPLPLRSRCIRLQRPGEKGKAQKQTRCIHGTSSQPPSSDPLRFQPQGTRMNSSATRVPRANPKDSLGGRPTQVQSLRLVTTMR